MLKQSLKLTSLVAATVLIACSFSKGAEVTGTADDEGGGTTKEKPSTVTGKIGKYQRQTNDRCTGTG